MSRKRNPLTLKQIEKARAASRRWKENNRERANAAIREYRHKYPEKAADVRKRWRDKNKKHILTYNRFYRGSAIISPYPIFGELSYKSRMENEIYKIAYNAVPRMASHIRDDIISSIVLDVLECKLAIETISVNVKQYIRAYYREYDQFKTISLDAIIEGTEKLTLYDYLADENNC